MADSSLDDFFAKKDKSKKSKSRKFTSGADSVAKASDDGGKMSERSKKEKEKVSNSSGTTTLQSPAVNDDDWKDVEEKETDYTGLKIQNVQISDLRDEDIERSRAEELLEEEQSRNKDSFGPWNRGAGGPTVVEPIVELPPAPVEKVAPKSDTGKYVPPSMREGATPLQPMSKSAGKGKSAPQLASEFDFPSLSSASDKKKDSSDLSKGKLTSQSSNIRRPYSELASKSEVTNQSGSS